MTNTTPLTQIENELKTQVAQACRIIGNNGTRGMLGHVSVRLPDSDIVYIKGRGPDVEGLEFATERDVITINMKGELLEAREGLAKPLEAAMHLAVFRSRPDVQSVIHAHPDWIVILTSAGKPLVAMVNAYDSSASARLVTEGIPIYPRSQTITTAELGDDMMTTMGERNVCLLFGHGYCIAGGSVEVATARSLNVYELARLNYLTYAIGTPKAIPDEDLAGAEPPMQPRPPGQRANTPSGLSSFWRYELKRLPAIPQEPA
jgi:ribulose-5-phosphate 4-epimerase/fuculose-1-phosphate aldolase